MMQDNFRSLLTKWCSFTDEQYLLFKSKFRQETYNKNEYWLKAGQHCSSIAFVESGLLRYYYLNNEGDEVTCYFASGNEFITSYQSYTQQTVAYENIEALTDVKFWVIDRADFNTLLTLLPQVKSIWEMAVQRLILQMDDRIAMLQSLSAEKRYQYLMQHHPELLLQIPLQYIASYIGITPQHLSRLRKSIS